MIRVGLDTPGNFKNLDNFLIEVKKKSNDAFLSVYDDIDNIIPDIPIDTFENQKNTKTSSDAIKQNSTNTPSSKQENFYANIKNKKWKKKYFPDSNIVQVKPKSKTDTTEYAIYSDGTVKELSKNTKPEIILNNDKQAAQVFTDVKNKKPFSVRNMISNIWKFFSATGTMIAATVKGTVYGGLTGAGVLGGTWIVQALPKAFTKEGPALSEVIFKPLKHISKTGKILAATGAFAVLAYNLVVGKLAANQKTAVIEHKMKTDHRAVNK